MHTNIDAALEALEAAQSDVEADFGDEEDVEVDGKDLVVVVAFECDDVTALELCRTQLGYVPSELVGRLGRADWLR